MTICREIGNFSWADTAEIRKLMSKSMGNERFAMFEAKFVEGAGQNGVSAEEAKHIWDQINSFGSWAFNKSHAVAYGYISYWCCWLKAHHPFEFAAATLTHESSVDRQIEILRELRSEGYDYVPVDPEVSTNEWTVGWREGKKILVGPLSNVNGIGPSVANAIIGARARGEPLSGRAEKLLRNPVTAIDSLTPIADAFERIMPDPSARNITTPPSAIGSLTPQEDPYPALLFCTPIRINPRNENEEISVQKRGYEINNGPVEFLQLFLKDDTGTIYAKINRWKFARIGREVISRGRAGKSLWAFKGSVLTIGDDGFMMLSVDAVRYIGDSEK